MARVIFMGSPLFAVPSLRALHAAGHEMVAVYTQPARPAGRGQQEQRTLVHEEAIQLGLGDRIHTPARLKGKDLEDVMALHCDVITVVAYGLLLPKELVDNRLCLNVHPSALPRWRGAAPIQHTLLAGDTYTEVCVMRLDAGMDTGPVVDRVALEIPANMTAGELQERAASIGAQRLAWAVENVDRLHAVEQSGAATLAPKITSEMRRVDWSANAGAVHNQIRGLSPTPGATAELEGVVVKLASSCTVEGEGKTGEILQIDDQGMVVACGEWAVRIARVQMPGKKMMTANEVARGWSVLKVGAGFTVK